MSINRDPVVHAFQMILSVPLGADNVEEYKEMKQSVWNYLHEIAKAGGLEEKYEQALANMVETIQSPEFHEFLKSYAQHESGQGN